MAGNEKAPRGAGPSIAVQSPIVVCDHASIGGQALNLDLSAGATGDTRNIATGAKIANHNPTPALTHSLTRAKLSASSTLTS